MWGYTAQAATIGTTALLLPVVATAIPPAELGMWFVFIALTSLAGLLDFGFQPTIARNVAYVYAGATRLERAGTSTLPGDKRVDYAFLLLLISTVRAIYRYIATLAGLFLVLVGGYYVYWLAASLSHPTEVLVAWVLYALASSLNLYFAYFTPMLQGSGRVTSANKVVVMSRVSFLVLATLFLIFDLGLLGVAIANLLSVAVARVVSYYYFAGELKSANAQELAKPHSATNLFPVIWHNSQRLGVVAVGAFLVLRGNTLLASAFLSLEETARYGLTLQVFSIVAAFSAAAFGVYVPQINQHRIRGHLDELRKDFAFANLLGWIVYVPLALIVVAFGNDLVNAMGSKTALLPLPALALVAVTAFLEQNHSNHGLMITTGNKVPFVAAALYSGCAVLVLSLLFLAYTSAGIWALLGSQAIVQAAYNNWKWPADNMRELGLQFKDLVHVGVKELRSRLRQV